MPNSFPSARRAVRLLPALILFAPSALAAQRQGGTLVGRVLAGDVAVPSATIIAGRGRVILTRVDGRYRLAMPVGRYEVRARRVGYSTVIDSVTIVAGGTSTLNFKLERSLVALEAISTVGSRAQVRRILDAPVPISVIGATDLRATGRTETALMLQALEPGVNVPRAGVAEGSDLVHPFTLRGMDPNHALVLVNGKRRHTSALMNVNNSVGRGTTGVDLNAIPASMIDRVEVLRDGATAQYGSDAVAGVVNIVLKSGVHGDAVTTVGRSQTTFNRGGDGSSFPSGERTASDGKALQASIDKGIVFGERGFLHGAFELRDRGFTDRSAEPGTSLGTVTDGFGDPQSHDATLFLNGGNQFANGLQVYGNAGASRRTMSAPMLQRSVPPSVGNGAYTPIIRPTLGDQAATLGVRGDVGDWGWDLSSTYGRNSVDYNVQHTFAATGGAVSDFNAGSVRYAQSTTTLELDRTLSFFEETRVAGGVEWRNESYRIGAGTAPSANVGGFPAFTATQATDHSRNDLAGFLDLESDLTPDLMVGLAGRAEHYSDVGTVGAGKLSVRWEPIRRQALRASVERGFRAPSLQQMYFSNSGMDRGTEVFQATVSAPGATLDPERTTTFSVGIAAEPVRTLSLSADLYRIEVKDRIDLPLFAGAGGVPDQAAAVVSGNNVDTRTQGASVNAGYAWTDVASGTLRLNAGLDVHSTTVTDRRGRAISQPDAYRVDARRIERGQPRNIGLISANYARGAAGALLRAQRFSDVTVAYVSPSTPDQTFAAKWIIDANLSYTLLRKYTFTGGVDNLFDVYPDRNATLDTGFVGTLPYNGSSPFGVNGRFVFARLSIYL